MSLYNQRTKVSKLRTYLQILDPILPALIQEKPL